MIKGYKCEHCYTFLTSKKEMANHEKQCLFNPAMKFCVTCSNAVWFEWFEGLEDCMVERPDHDERYESNHCLCPDWMAKCD